MESIDIGVISIDGAPQVNEVKSLLSINSRVKSWVLNRVGKPEKNTMLAQASEF